MTSAQFRALVPVEPQPAKVVQNRVLGHRRGPLGIGVLDAQDERAVLPARHQPVEQRRARVAHVKLACRARRKSHPGRAHRASPPTRTATAWAAIASPRPTASTLSFVLPFTLTWSIVTPSVAARRSRIAGECGASFGRSSTTVRSTFVKA